MESYIRYIENALSGAPDDPVLFRFKKGILDEMTARANALTATGLHDEQVLSDLVISEHPDLRGEYNTYAAAANKKRRKAAFLKWNIIGSVLYVLALVTVYLTVSFLTRDWAHTWLIMEGGMSLWLGYLLVLGIKKCTAMRRAFHPIARVLLALLIMLISVFVFLFCLAVLHLAKSWLVFIAAVALLFLADGIYAAATHQKMAIINWLIYVPAMAPMIYILLCATGVLPWSPGWLIMPGSVLVDIVLVIAALIHNSKYVYKQEVAEPWNAD